MYLAVSAIFGIVAYELYSIIRNYFYTPPPIVDEEDNADEIERIYYNIADLSTEDKSIIVRYLSGNNIRKLSKFRDFSWIKLYMPYRYTPYNSYPIWNLSRLMRDDMRIIAGELSYSAFSKLNRFKDNADALKDMDKFANGQLIAYSGDKIYKYPHMEPINYYKLLLLYFSNTLYSPYENIYPIYIYRDGFLIHLSWYGSSFNIITKNAINAASIRDEIECERMNSENGKLRSIEIRDGLGIILSRNISQKGAFRVNYKNPFFFPQR